MDRRTFLTLATAGAGAALFGVEFWHRQYTMAAVTPGVGPYGALRPADVNGISLPDGFTSRVIARSGQRLGSSGYIWHAAPDGGACFQADSGGWVYVSNSEIGNGGGGASAVRIAPDGSIVDAYRILAGTSRNCAGGPTPWGTWLSCEENGSGGRVWECDPMAAGQGIRRDLLGAFSHEAAAVDPATGRVYLTEDDPNGRLYRFTPTVAGDLSSGVLHAARVTEGQLTWVPSSASGPDRQATTTAFNGGEGAWIHAGALFFTTKGDNRIWEARLGTGTISVLYDAAATAGTPLSGVDNVTAHGATGDLFVCEDGGNMEICVLASVAGGNREIAPFLRVSGQSSSELTGVAFNPSGTRMYFSSQRGSDGTGITYEVSGPFRTSVPTPTTTTTTTTTSPTTPTTTSPTTTSPPTTSTTTSSTTTSTTTSPTTSTPPVTETLLARGATWKYLDDGSNQGTAWRQRTFSDAAWRSGPAPLGYGDPVATVVSYGQNANKKYITTYFRRAFQASHRYGRLTLRVRRDDGVVVYVNGAEVARSNMPTGTIRHNTLAVAQLDGADETAYVEFDIAAELVNGANVVAAELHQATRSTNDAVFDLELIGTGNTGPLV